MKYLRKLIIIFFMLVVLSGLILFGQNASGKGPEQVYDVWIGHPNGETEFFENVPANRFDYLNCTGYKSIHIYDDVYIVANENVLIKRKYASE